MDDTQVIIGGAKPAAPITPPAEVPNDAAHQAAVETPKTPETPPTTPQTPEWEFKVEHFNKWAGSEFKNEDEVKSSLKSLSKVKDYENVIKERDELKTKYEEIQSQLDPRSYFVNDDEFKRQLILRKYPEGDPYVMSKVLSLDEKTSKDIDILIAGEMLKGIDEVSAKELIYDKFSISDDNADFDKLTLAKLKSEAAGVRKQIAEIKDVKLPEKVDFETKRQNAILEQQKKLDKLKADSTPFVEKIMEGLKEVNLPIEIEEGKVDNALKFEVDEQFRNDFKNILLEGFLDGTFTLDEKGVSAAYNYAANTYTNLKLPQMISKLKKQLNAEFEDAKHAALHNDKPLSQEQAPAQEQKGNTLGELVTQAFTQQSSRGVQL
jgi:hypothetical protein